MCGIVAFFSRRHPVAEAVLTRATESLYHRGPDGRRHWVSADGSVGLGHARLSIIDLATGDQPIASDPESPARFGRETRAIAALSPPNILAIHDFVSHEGVTYAVTELRERDTLRQTVTPGPLPVRRSNREDPVRDSAGRPARAGMRPP